MTWGLRGAKYNSKVFVLRTWKDRVVINWEGEGGRRKEDLGMKIRRGAVLDMSILGSEEDLYVTDRI